MVDLILWTNPPLFILKKILKPHSSLNLISRLIINALIFKSSLHQTSKRKKFKFLSSLWPIFKNCSSKLMFLWKTGKSMSYIYMQLIMRLGKNNNPNRDCKLSLIMKRKRLIFKQLLSGSIIILKRAILSLWKQGLLAPFRGKFKVNQTVRENSGGSHRLEGLRVKS